MIHISENFIIDGYNNRTILRDTIKEKILSQSHYSPFRDVMLEANFLSEQPRRATGDGDGDKSGWYKDNKTDELVWFEEDPEDESFEYIGWSVSYTDVDAIRTVYDPVTHAKIVNGKVEEYFLRLDEVEITNRPNEDSTIVKIIDTVLVLFNAYSGFKEMGVSVGLVLLPDPTFVSKAGAMYFGTDGFVRMSSTPFIIYGIWDNNKNYANAPHNILSVGGYIADHYTGNRRTRKYQTSFGLIGDFGHSRYLLRNQLIKGVNTIREGLSTGYNIFEPYIQGYRNYNNK